MSDFIKISGENFYRVSDVFFGAVRSNNISIVNNNIIYAEVPRNATWDKVTVLSSARSVSGISPFEFVPIPYPQSYNTSNPYVGSSVQFSGDHFSGVSGIYFNGILSNSTYVDPMTDNGVTTISAVVPSGQVRGYFRMVSRSGVSTLSNFIFEPTIFISGLSPSSYGFTGQALTITGLYFVPELLEAGPDPESYYVYIGNSNKMQFYRTSASTLTGLIGTGATTGPIRFSRYNGGKFGGPLSFTVLDGYPYIDYCAPTPINYLNESRLYGGNFLTTYAITWSGGANVPDTGILSGWNVNNLGNQISIPSTGFASDYPIGSGLTVGYRLTVYTVVGEATGANPTIQIKDINKPGSGAYPYTGIAIGYYNSGAATVQLGAGYFSNLTNYDVTLEFPVTSGHNWYGTGTGYHFAYGMGRSETYGPSSTGAIELGISGTHLMIEKTLTGRFIAADGYNATFPIYILTGTGAYYTTGGGGDSPGYDPSTIGGGDGVFQAAAFDSTTSSVFAMRQDFTPSYAIDLVKVSITPFAEVNSLAGYGGYNVRCKNGYAFVKMDGNVFVIDTATNTLDSTLSIMTEGAVEPNHSYAMCLDGDDLYVACGNTDAEEGVIAKIDTTTQTVTSQSTEDFIYSSLVDIHLNPINGYLYACNRNNYAGLKVYDPSDWSLVTTISLWDADPYGIAYDPINDKYWIAYENSTYISIIDPTTNLEDDVITMPASFSVRKSIAYDSARQLMVIGANNDWPNHMYQYNLDKTLAADIVTADPFYGDVTWIGIGPDDKYYFIDESSYVLGRYNP